MIPLQLRGGMRGLLMLLTLSVSSCAKLKFDNPYDPQNRPLGPQAFSPSEGATITDNPPQFSWASCGVDSAYYHLQISTDSLFSSIVFEDDHLQGTTLGISYALPYGQLNWRVRAAKAKEAWGPWSLTHHFFVKYGPVFYSPLIGFDLCLKSNRLYTAYEGFQTWDVSNPVQPQPLGSYHEESSCRIAVNDGYAYLIWLSTSKPLQVIDVSNPTNPILVGSAALYNDAYALSIEGDVGYVWGLEDSPEPYNLQVLDLSDKRNPRVEGHWQGGGTLSSEHRIGLQVKGTVCYASAVDSLFILDCQDPTSPRLVRSLPNTGGLLAIDGERLYALSWYGLDIYDLRDPFSPNRLAHHNWTSAEFAVQGGVLYQIGLYDWVTIWDLNVPLVPKLLGTVSTYGYRVAVQGDYVYLVGSSGFTVVRVR